MQYLPCRSTITAFLIASLAAGCATGRQVCFTSQPPGATVKVSGRTGWTPCFLKVPFGEQSAVVSLPGAGQREIHLEGESSRHAQVRLDLAKAASITCYVLSAPFLLVGAAGLWLTDCNADDEDKDDEEDDDHDHDNLEAYCLSAGSLVIGGLLYYTGQGLEDIVDSMEPHIHVVFPPLEKPGPSPGS